MYSKHYAVYATGMMNGNSVFQSFFGRHKTAEEQVKEWKSKLRVQSREIDREIRGIESQENKIKTELKQLSKKSGSQKAIRTLATELVRSQKAKDHLLTGKTHINSTIMQMQEQVSMVRVTGCIKKSTQVMNSMNRLLKLPQIRDSMYNMAKEMTKAGLIEELVNDTMSSMENEEEQDIMDAEVDAIVDQILTGKILHATAVPVCKPEQTIPSKSPEDEDEELVKMREKLQSLK